MASIGSVWPPARRPRLALLAAVVLSLLMVACAKASPPEGVVDDYLSDATGGDAKSALERWELSELGAAPADLAPEQFTTRVEGRGRLAQALTAALAAAGDDLQWELSGQVLYDLAEGVAVVAASADAAEVATVEVALTLQRRDAEAVEERLAFTLWHRADGGWRVTGLDKGLAALEGLLEELGSD